MVPAIVFDVASRAVSLIVRPALGHEPTLVDFMKEDVPKLFRLQVVVEPNFMGRDKFIDLVVPPFGVIDKKQVADELAVYDPNLDAIGALFLEELLMNFRDVFGFLGMGSNALPNEIDLAALLHLGLVRQDKGVVVSHAFAHQAVLDKHMVDEKFRFSGRALVVDPEFVLRNKPEPVVLAEVGEFLAEVVADIFPVDGINGELRNRGDLFDIRLFHGDFIIAKRIPPFPFF